ncbi:MAG: LarC family nickel insertion protein, partial [Planctomycetota bacterium]
AVLEGARGLDARGLEDAKRVFEALAEAEGRVHGRPAEEVHFHEVGALDALVDIVGTCTGLRRLGVDEVRVGPLPFGTGTVKTAHGELPLPAPAVLHLLAGLPTVPSLETHEQVTPTGAALVAVLATGSTPPAGFTVRRTGTGAGTFEGGRLPNVVRLVVGEVPEEGPEETTPADAVLLETNLDDATGQVIARALECALAAGALDAWATPIQMKKGRPGVLVSVLGRPEERERLEALLFRELPTTGIRRRATRRTVLVRRPVSVETPWGPVGVKVRETPDGPEGTPEYEDCARRASEHDVAVRRVIEAARAAFAARS